jgi:VIT1/CCC1 family predicted Fe2+/Mn2+ transporter
MGVSIALQLFMTLYNGGLMGLQKQVLANKIQMGYSLFRSGLVIIPIYFVRDVYAYFIWQIIGGIVFLLITRYHIWQFIKSTIVPVFSPYLLRNI